MLNLLFQVKLYTFLASVVYVVLFSCRFTTLTVLCEKKGIVSRYMYTRSKLISYVQLSFINLSIFNF